MPFGQAANESLCCWIMEKYLIYKVTVGKMTPYLFLQCAQCHRNRICWRTASSQSIDDSGSPPDTMSLYTIPTTRAVLVAILLWFALLFTLLLPFYTLLLLVPTCFNQVPLKTFLKRKRKTKLRVHLPIKVPSLHF